MEIISLALTTSGCYLLVMTMADNSKMNTGNKMNEQIPRKRVENINWQTYI